MKRRYFLGTLGATTVAVGRWAKPFGGATDNTDIGKKLIELLG